MIYKPIRGIAMFNINKCKHIARSLSNESKEKLGDKKSQDFSNTFDKIVDEYRSKNMFSSTAIELQKLKSFNDWIQDIINEKNLFTPIIVDKMVNERDLYSLSLYQNLYVGTDLNPDISNYKLEYYENGGGENALALITGCHWVEQSGLTN